MSRDGGSWMKGCLLALALSAGCGELDGGRKDRCEHDGDCVAGYRCVEKSCVEQGEGCDDFCASACTTLDECAVDLGRDCLDWCAEELGGRDCTRLEPLDRRTCSELEGDFVCVPYCDRICARGAECVDGFELENCRAGCNDADPELCNPASIGPRDCDAIKRETRDYERGGRALAEGKGYFYTVSLSAIGLCRDGEDCEGTLGCSARTNTCAQCTMDSECADEYGVEACLEGECALVECRANDDCSSSVCNVDAHECGECRQDADCDSGVCDTARYVCGECRGDEQCMRPGMFSGSMCDVVAMECVQQCTADRHCGGLNPICDVSRHRCVECTGNEHCTDPRYPFCSTSNICSSSAGDP